MIFPWDEIIDSSDIKSVDGFGADNLTSLQDVGFLGFKALTISNAIDGVVEVFTSVFEFSSIESYKTINEKQKDLIKQNPKFAPRNLSDGYELETEKLLAIQQKSSKGFKVYDVNPGLLSETDYPLSLSYEFIYNGVNYNPETDGSLGKHFRTINIDEQGTYLMIEFLTEHNSIMNSSTSEIYSSNLPARPYAKRKYNQLIPLDYDQSGLDNPVRYENASKNVVFLNFGQTNTRPLKISRSGVVIESYFTDLTLTVMVGGPKIRVTIGYNSKISPPPVNDAINANLETAGMSRVLTDLDNPLVPFNIRYTDILLANIPFINQGISLDATSSDKFLGFTLVTNNLNMGGNIPIPIGAGSYELLGYSVLWITDINISLFIATANAMTDFSITLDIVSNFGVTYNKRIWSHDFTSAPSAYNEVFNFSKPMRVVIPAGCSLKMNLAYKSTVNTIIRFKYNITGYSFGELLKKQFDAQARYIVFASKVMTDSVLINQLSDSQYSF